MKIPENKLPLKLGKLQIYGQYQIGFIKYEDSIPSYKYAGQIASKDLSQYIVKAANKFPEAIELLNNCLDILNELDAIEWHEESNFQYSTYSDIKEELEEFLNNLEDEKS